MALTSPAIPRIPARGLELVKIKSLAITWEELHLNSWQQRNEPRADKKEVRTLEREDRSREKVLQLLMGILAGTVKACAAAGSFCFPWLCHSYWISFCLNLHHCKVWANAHFANTGQFALDMRLQHKPALCKTKHNLDLMFGHTCKCLSFILQSHKTFNVQGQHQR